MAKSRPYSAILNRVPWLPDGSQWRDQITKPARFASRLFLFMIPFITKRYKWVDMKVGWKNIGFLMVLLLSGMAANAEHAAVAYLDDGSWGGWAARATKQQAEAAALKGCREVNPSDKCAIQYGVAISRAESQSRMGLSASTNSKAESVKQAVANCGEADCKPVWTKSVPGFYAIFLAGKNGEPVEYYLQHGADTGNWALEEGKRNCEKANKVACEPIAFGAIKGNFTAAQAAAPSRPQASAPSCRPKTTHLRCSSQCFNGDCTVTYENGCKMRVQVQPQFNGSSWVYPAPSC